MFFVALAIAAISLASCGDSGLLSPLSAHTSEASLTTVSPGTIAVAGDQFPLTLKYNAGVVTPKDLKVEILNSAGTVLQSGDIQGIDFTAPLPPVQLPNLTPGTYTMQLTLYDGNNQIITQSTVEFFFANGPYSLQGIASYPPTISPGGTGVVSATLAVPDGSNPYLRWTMGGKTLDAGYLQDGLDKIQWTAPSAAGVYSVTVELFPYGPSTGGSFDFTSPISMHTEIYVSDTAPSTANGELGPAADYYCLLHFGGTLQDSGALGGADTVTTVGNPQLAVNGSLFGYQLDGNSGFRTSSFPLPVASGGTLAPFSVEMRLRLDSYQFNRVFFTATQDSGSPVFQIASNDKGLLLASVGGTPEASGIALPIGQMETVVLSVIPEGSSLELLWFTNGQLVEADSLSASPRVQSASGGSEIAGANGFAGLIAEFGVFYRDASGQAAIDPSVFASAMAEQYGAAFVYAEGFDGMELPSDLQFSAGVSASDLQGGSLALPAGASVTLPEQVVGEDELCFDLSLSLVPAGASGAVVFSANGSDIDTIDFGGSFDASQPFSIRLSSSGGELTITQGSASKSFQGDLSPIGIRVVNTGAAQFDVRSFLVFKDKVRITSAGVDTASAAS